MSIWSAFKKGASSQFGKEFWVWLRTEKMPGATQVEIQKKLAFGSQASVSKGEGDGQLTIDTLLSLVILGECKWAEFDSVADSEKCIRAGYIRAAERLRAKATGKQIDLTEAEFRVIAHLAQSGYFKLPSSVRAAQQEMREAALRAVGKAGDDLSWLDGALARWAVPIHRAVMDVPFDLLGLAGDFPGLAFEGDE